MIIKLLIKRGVNIHVTDKYGISALTHAVLSSNTIAIKKRSVSPPVELERDYDSIQSVKTLLEAGIDINFQSHVDKSTALMVAVNHPGLLSIMLEAGADPNLANIQGITPLHYAVLATKDSVQRLLHFGAISRCGSRRSYTVVYCNKK